MMHGSMNIKCSVILRQPLLFFPRVACVRLSFWCLIILCGSGSIILLSHPTKGDSEVPPYIHESFVVRII